LDFKHKRVILHAITPERRRAAPIVTGFRNQTSFFSPNPITSGGPHPVPQKSPLVMNTLDEELPFSGGLRLISMVDLPWREEVMRERAW
jgi:hypothetical protein